MSTTTIGKPVAPHAAWAERLARLRRHVYDVPVETMAPETWIPGATALLWTYFDTAVAQATSALHDGGQNERILTRRTDREYWLEMPGPAGEARQIAVFVSLRAVDGKIVGGAQISTSQTRAVLYLQSSVHGGRLRWIIPATGTAFTERVVDDLLLSVFGDDAVATQRLMFYFSLDTDA